MQRLTHLGRRIDLRHRSNRHAVAAGVATGAVALAVNIGRAGLSGATARASIMAGVGAFLAWAIGRELDPDRPNTGLVAAIGSIGTTLWLGEPSLSLLAAILLTARVLLRPAGRPPRIMDLGGLILLGAYLGTQPGGWGAGLVLAFAVARDRRLPGTPPQLSRISAGLIAALTTAVTIRVGQSEWTTPSLAAWAVLAGGVLAAATTTPDTLLSSSADHEPSLLDPRRLASARRVALAGLLASAAVAGQEAIVGTAPAWMAVCAVPLVQRRGLADVVEPI